LEMTRRMTRNMTKKMTKKMTKTMSSVLRKYAGLIKSELCHQRCIGTNFAYIELALSVSGLHPCADWHSPLTS
jgi:hypothetical protein